MRVVTLVALLLALLVFGIGSASAHSRPVRFDPAPGALLEAAPTSIQGWFSSDLRRDPASTFIHVIDSAKNRVEVGEPALSANRRQMSAQLKPGLAPGAYLVHWSTFDDGDGEVFAGCYVFYVGQQAADVAIASGKPMDGSDVCPANSPANKSTVAIAVKTSGNSATVDIKSENLTLKLPDGSPIQPDVGHYHIYLDKAPIDVLTEHSHAGETGGTSSSSGHDHGSQSSSNGLAENPVHWDRNSYTFNNLPPGQHYVAVALFHDHTTPFSPPVVAEQAFTIGGAGDGGGVRLWIVILGVIGALAGGLALGKLVATGPEQ